MKSLFACSVGCLAVSLASAQSPDIPQLRSGDIPGLVVTRTGHFDGKSLYGYMDGGAELYREYGFIDLTVQEMRVNDQQLLVELFRMSDPLAAFGVFSVSRGDCSGEDTTARFWCHTPGQAMCAAGPYFLKVQRLTSGSGGSGLASAVARRFLQRLPESGGVVLPWISGGATVQAWQRKAILVFGPLGLQNGFPDWVDPMEEAGYRSMTIIPWDVEGTTATVGWICCDSVQAASSLERHFALATRPAWQYIRRCEGNCFLVIEAELPADRLTQFARRLFIH
jgi:hypothetical protein